MPNLRAQTRPIPEPSIVTSPVRMSRQPGWCRTVLATLLLAFLTAPLQADWLVTRDGQRTETRGPWEVRGRIVVFTSASGVLMSMRALEVDLEASEELTRRAVEGAEQPAQPEPEVEKPAKDPIMVLTNRDVGFGTDGAQGVEGLVDRLRNAHQYHDTDLALTLVNFSDTPEGMQNFVSDQMSSLMQRRILDIQVSEVSPDENLERVQDGVAYEPNLEVTHKLTLELAPDPEEDSSTLSFFVGTRLGSYYIASARPIEGGL